MGAQCDLCSNCLTGENCCNGETCCAGERESSSGWTPGGILAAVMGAGAGSTMAFTGAMKVVGSLKKKLKSKKYKVKDPKEMDTNDTKADDVNVDFEETNSTEKTNSTAMPRESKYLIKD